MTASQYPPDYHPPCVGRCEVCGEVTKGWTRDWLARCPRHWQALMQRCR